MKLLVPLVSLCCITVSTVYLTLGDQPVPVEQQKAVVAQVIAKYTASAPNGIYCPAGDAQAVVRNDYAAIDIDGGIMAAVHCAECRIGVYSKNDDGNETCTYCSAVKKSE